jgi:hypothetical protein
VVFGDVLLLPLLHPSLLLLLVDGTSPGHHGVVVAQLDAADGAPLKLCAHAITASGIAECNTCLSHRGLH